MIPLRSSSPKRETASETRDPDIASAVTITLPFPISVNGAFRRFNGKYLSARYRHWRDAAGWEVPDAN